MKPENPLLLKQLSSILESAADVTARREKLLAADRARAAALLSAISFRCGSQVDSVEKIIKNI